MDGGNDEDPLSPDLSCQENPEFLYDEVPVENPDDGTNNLIHIEIEFGFQRDEALIIPNWVLEVRSESITWALNRTAAFGFQSSTVVYLFVTYFHRFISLTSIAMPIVEERPEIRLLSVACLSLAAWTERMMLPPLSQHEDGDYFFATGSTVQKAHGVLTALGWDMDIITPFAFLDYLVPKLWQEFPPDVKFQIAAHLRSVMTGRCVFLVPSNAGAVRWLKVNNPKGALVRFDAFVSQVGHQNSREFCKDLICLNVWGMFFWSGPTMFFLISILVGCVVLRCHANLRHCGINRFFYANHILTKLINGYF